MGNTKLRDCKRAQETAIESWMTAIVKDGGIDRRDHLHVDQIDRRWGPRNLWVEAGITSYKIAVALRDRLRLPVTVAVAFPLISRIVPDRAEAQTLQELAARLDTMQPPSLNLFWNEKEPWVLGSGIIFWLSVSLTGDKRRGTTWRYSQYLPNPDGNDWVATVWCTS